MGPESEKQERDRLLFWSRHQLYLLKALMILSGQYKHVIAYMGINLANNTLIKIAHDKGTQPTGVP